jgi:AcrR family transcriptional regulator
VSSLGQVEEQRHAPEWLFEAAIDEKANYARLTKGLAAGPGDRSRRAQSQILIAAWQLFGSLGYAAVTIEEIARTAQVSRPAVYSYFYSKRSIFLALAVAVNSRYQRKVRSFAEISEVRSLEAGVGPWVTDYVQFLEETHWFTLMWDNVVGDDQLLREEGVRQQQLAWSTFGSHLVELGRGRGTHQSLLDGMIVLSMLERVWFYWSLADGPVPRTALESELTSVIISIARGS